MPDTLFSSLDLVPNSPTILVLYLFTTSGLHALWIHTMYSEVRSITPIGPVIGGEIYTSSYNTHCLSCQEIARGVRENGRNCR